MFLRHLPSICSDESEALVSVSKAGFFPKCRSRLALRHTILGLLDSLMHGCLTSYKLSILMLLLSKCKDDSK